MAENKITGFLKLVLKNGGASFVLTLLLAWLFREYFQIDPVMTTTLLEFMLWLAFFQSIFTLVRGEFFTTLQKWLDYKSGKRVASTTNGLSMAEAARDAGLETFVALVHKASELKEKISKTPEEKERIQLEKDLVDLQKAIEEKELELIE